MAISVMKKVSLIGAKSDVETIINKLTWAKSIDVENAPEDFGAKSDDVSYRISYANAVKKTLTDSLLLLKPYREITNGLFKRRKSYKRDVYDSPDVTLARAMQTFGDASYYSESIQKCKDDIQKQNSIISSLAPWLTLDLPFSSLETEKCTVTLGSIPTAMNIAELCDEASANGLYVYAEKCGVAGTESGNVKTQSVVLTAMKQSVNEALHIFERAGFVKCEFSHLTETPVQESVKAKNEVDKLTKQLSEYTAKMMDTAKKADVIELACDILDTKIERLLAKEKLAYSEYTVLLTGYIPEKDTERTLKALDSIACYVEFSPVTEDDDPPTKLDNNSWAKPFEPIVETYALPKYGSFDPSFIMSIFYFVIFGLMFADVVYGMLIVLACLVFARKLDLSDGMKKMVKMFGYCGISCVICGVIFGSYLGDLIAQLYKAYTGNEFTTVLGINILNSDGVMTFIIIALVTGALHLLTGMALNMYMLWKDGQKFSAIFDVGSWFVIFAGAGLVALIGGYVSIGVLALGLLMKIGTAGREKKGILGKILGGVLGLYDIIGYASDLISYMRIMALGLSSAVIASVVNIMATIMIANNAVIGTMVMIPILLLGHSINIALNLLGCYVHTSRLQYIEFFSKFFIDGGRAYKPLEPKSSYTVIDEDDSVSNNKE